MQEIDLQSPLERTSPETTWCHRTASAASETPLAPVPFRPDALVGTLSRTAKVMIVDDEPVNVKVVQKHLKLAGYQHFVTSTDPRPVLEMIAQEMPDVILIDVMMPHISGLEILESCARTSGWRIFRRSC